MRLEKKKQGAVELAVLVVSRRNLEALLAKLDGFPPDSKCTIAGGSEAPGVILKAEENDVHYAHRDPGNMHIATEAAIKLSMIDGESN